MSPVSVLLSLTRTESSGANATLSFDQQFLYYLLSCLHTPRVPRPGEEPVQYGEMRFKNRVDQRGTMAAAGPACVKKGQ